MIESVVAANSALRIRGLTKRFGALLANDSIDLQLRQGEVLALLGENGAGKSTLVSQLFGHYVPDSGSIELFGQPLPPGRPDLALARGMGMVHQHFTLAERLTVLDNVMVGTENLWSLSSQRSRAEAKLLQLATQYGLEIKPHALIAELSMGERQRVEILKALYRGARVLILDEPTAVLTPLESEQLFKTLSHLVNNGLAIIFISHKLDEVLRVADRVVVLRHGKLVAEVNNPKGLQNDRPTVDRQRLAQLMVGQEVRVVKRERSGASSIAQQTQQAPYLELKQFRLKADAAAFDLSLFPGEVVAIAGVAGNGQHELAQKLMRRPIESPDPQMLGALKWHPDLQTRDIARISVDRQGLGVVKDAALWENAVMEDLTEPRFVKFQLLNHGQARQHAQNLIQQFDVRCEHHEVKTARLSGGNIQKLVLGRNLIRKPKVIIAEQPTWGLDVGAVASIHAQLLAAVQQGAGLLLISEDLDEVFALADRIAVMVNHQIIATRSTNDWDLASLGLAMAGSRS